MLRLSYRVSAISIINSLAFVTAKSIFSSNRTMKCNWNFDSYWNAKCPQTRERFVEILWNFHKARKLCTIERVWTAEDSAFRSIGLVACVPLPLSLSLSLCECLFLEVLHFREVSFLVCVSTINRILNMFARCELAKNKDRAHIETHRSAPPAWVVHICLGLLEARGCGAKINI